MLIYKDIRFDEYLEATYKRGGIAAHAARKAEDIIHRLTRMDSIELPKHLISLGHGEHRIENCRKVGLPGGYRLVFILKDNLVIFCFIGEHNECYRWVEANRKLRYEQFDERLVAVSSYHTDCTDDLALDDNLDGFDKGPFSSHNGAISEDYIAELRYIEAYEQSILSKVNTPEGQRTIIGWFR
jgi:hypothetical protein